LYSWNLVELIGGNDLHVEYSLDEHNHHDGMQIQGDIPSNAP